MFSLLAIANTLTRLVSLPAWVWLGRRIGSFNAYLAHCLILAFTHFLFIFLGEDTASCHQFYFALVLGALWGAAYGGSLFLYSILSNIADYDEFLTGRRREAQYMMAVAFLPKFLEVPSEAIPLLLLANFGYKRPLPDGPDPEQPVEVVWLLRLTFSVIPALFIACGAIVINKFPSAARTDAAKRELLNAIWLHEAGKVAQDPWFPGKAMPPPPPPSRSEALLSHFWPSELVAALSVGTTPTALNYQGLLWRPWCCIVVAFVLAVPGAVITIVGWSDLGDDLGASVSPLGVMILGVSGLLIWFNGTRLWAVMELKKQGVPRQDVVSHYNYMCRFTGGTMVAELPPEGRDLPSVEELSSGPPTSMADLPPQRIGRA
eukprot:CAMPEP_0180434964 /NCGR_PEP_ID=MMETSP1036_2-20121128/10228_1 /TAXON_ID=632150 /ORGANISM="Azadinium spinosum, Strain 3D9" /LENGTH=374 /DNA_ID=CAMNT_0022440857 /DNA_START=327 /DNA_END=1452 /DNA_ORIENTATION=-